MENRNWKSEYRNQKSEQLVEGAAHGIYAQSSPMGPFPCAAALWAKAAHPTDDRLPRLRRPLPESPPAAHFVPG